jgi:hypothetical protein
MTYLKKPQRQQSEKLGGHRLQGDREVETVVARWLIAQKHGLPSKENITDRLNCSGDCVKM